MINLGYHNISKKGLYGNVQNDYQYFNKLVCTNIILRYITRLAYNNLLLQLLYLLLLLFEHLFC
mgnify:CR=1 FL=1